MAYCTADTDVRALLKKVTDAIYTDSEVTYFIGKSDYYIDARLYQLYSVPFATTPPMVTIISSHLAAYFVLRTLYVQARTADTDAWMSTFKDYAYDLLRDIKKGDILLLDSSGNKITRKTSRGIDSSTADYSPTFNEGDPLDWETDPGKE